MKKQYDFSKGKRGPVLPIPPGKERITIRLDSDVLDYFRDEVDRAGGGNYQTLINSVLRAHVEGRRQPTIEDTLRRVIREELVEGKLVQMRARRSAGLDSERAGDEANRGR